MTTIHELAAQRKVSLRFYGIVGGLSIMMVAVIVFLVSLLPPKDQKGPSPDATSQFRTNVEFALADIRSELKSLREARGKEVESCVRDVAGQINYMNSENCRTMELHLFEMKNALEQCLEKRQGEPQVYGGKGTL